MSKPSKYHTTEGESGTKWTSRNNGANRYSRRNPDLEPNPFNKWPAELQCFCGSTKEFRDCHKPKISKKVFASDYQKLKKNFEILLKAARDKESAGETFEGEAT